MYVNILLLLDWKNTVNISHKTVYGIFTSDTVNLCLSIYSYKALEIKVSNILILLIKQMYEAAKNYTKQLLTY